MSLRGKETSLSTMQLTSKQQEWQTRRQIRIERRNKVRPGILLGAKFNKAVVKWPEYDGLHTTFPSGSLSRYTEENDKWAKEVLKHLKNVRSVLDTVDFNAGESEAKMWALAGAACIGISAWSQSQ